MRHPYRVEIISSTNLVDLNTRFQSSSIMLKGVPTNIVLVDINGNKLNPTLLPKYLI